MSYYKNYSSTKRKGRKNKVPYNQHLQHNHHKVLGRPLIIGYMSVDGNRQYCSDLSQLKFLNNNSNISTSLDLNHSIDAAIKRSTDENNEKIDLLLQFLLHQNQYISSFYKGEGLDFITYRRTLISVMCSAFTSSEPLIVKACLFQDKIYLCSVESAQELLRRQARTKDEEMYCAWGYKFEQYLLSGIL